MLDFCFRVFLRFALRDSIRSLRLPSFMADEFLYHMHRMQNHRRHRLADKAHTVAGHGAARGCHDAAVSWKAPYISGKDSLNNEYADVLTLVKNDFTALIRFFIVGVTIVVVAGGGVV